MLQVVQVAAGRARDPSRATPCPLRRRAYARDTVTLGWEERLQARAPPPVGRRGRVRHGARRAAPCCAAATASSSSSRRSSSPWSSGPKPVFVIEPRTPAEWALFAYHIGNSHQPMMVTDEAIVCADLPGMEQVLEYHRIPFTERHPAVHAGRRHRGPSRISRDGIACCRCCICATACFRRARSRTPTAWMRRPIAALVRTAADLGAWMDASLSQVLGAVDGPAVLLAWQAFRRARLGRAVDRSTPRAAPCGRRRGAAGEPGDGGAAR